MEYHCITLAKPTSDRNCARQHVLNSTVFAHSLSAVVAMCPGTVPVALNWLWIKRNNDTKVFCDTVEQETCQPQMVTHFNSLTRTNLWLTTTSYYNNNTQTDYRPWPSFHANQDHRFSTSTLPLHTSCLTPSHHGEGTAVKEEEWRESKFHEG